jgi:hypothetical protein
LIIPLFYFLWKFPIAGFTGNEIVLATFLGQMILVLSAIKLLQKKSNKDWIFLYLISFFEVLLAAGLSISPLYVVSFILFLLTGICAIITFEIRKTSEIVQNNLIKQKNSAQEVGSKLFWGKLPFGGCLKLRFGFCC